LVQEGANADLINRINGSDSIEVPSKKQCRGLTPSAGGFAVPFAAGKVLTFGTVATEATTSLAVPEVVPAVTEAAAGDVAASGNTSTVFRVQGGVMPNASKTLITIDADGNPIIRNGTLNISIGDSSHAAYFQTLRPGGTVTSFEIPTWMDNFIQENAIPQFDYRSNPLNQNGLAPKIVDPTTPGRSYELPSPWGQWLQENAIPGSGKVK